MAPVRAPARHPAAAPRAAALLRAAGALAAVGAAGAGYGALEARTHRLRRVEVPVLPREQAPLRVLHLSDLHLTGRDTAKQRWVRGLARLDPHLVVDTGDNLASAAAVPAALHALEPLLAVPGAFVLGSNDYHEPRAANPARYLRGPSRQDGERRELPWRELVAGLTASGWADLTNARAQLVVDGRSVDLVGVDDPHLRRDRYHRVSAPARAGADLLLGVAHAPYRRVLDAMAADGAGLVLAGHTHGGQLRVPGVGALVTNCDLPRAMARGLHRWPAPGGRAGASSRSALSTWLHVSAGMGTSPYAPVRVACPPEVTLLTLVARA